MTEQELADHLQEIDIMQNSVISISFEIHSRDIDVIDRFTITELLKLYTDAPEGNKPKPNHTQELIRSVVNSWTKSKKEFKSSVEIKRG